MSSTNELREEEGDIFDAPPGSALMHACSVQGSWGKGIALGFKNKYPAAYQRYRAYCLTILGKPGVHDIPNRLTSQPKYLTVRYPVGTTLIIPPQEQDLQKGRAAHWIICLFTSYDYGQRVDPPHTIRNNTAAALEDLRVQLRQMELENKSGGPECFREIYSCRFNSGLFNVPWEKSKVLVEKAGLDLPVTVIYPPENTNQQKKN